RPSWLFIVTVVSPANKSLVPDSDAVSRRNARMPISYSVDKSMRVVFEVWSGDVCAADLRRYWQGYLADPEVLALRRTLVDLRGANLHFSGWELAELVASVVLPVLKGSDWQTAIV